ncbi:hypothetical protein F5Y19DRAFT_353289 [Xylariaceae sp. FL1651]|nr:hypothetical protein F5Y19DRAFT_353289 [Xylariaceae sp. FL1651]
MLYSSLLLLLAFGLLAEATEGYSPLSELSHRRQVMTCEQTYGNGSVLCGGAESAWCFNPSLGQTCCPLDNGFCNKGKYCAPVAGYCCFDSEDLATCAKNAGFDLPSLATEPTAIAASTMGASTGISRTFTVSPFLEADPRPTVMITLDGSAESSMGPSTTTCHETPSFAAPLVTAVSNTSISPFVQVSIAVKDNRALFSSIAIVGVASVFASFL